MIEALKELLGLGPDARAEAEAADPNLALAALLVEMARADHEQTEEEREVLLEALSQHLGLATQEAHALLARGQAESEASVSLYDYTRALNEKLDDGQRVQVLELLWRVAAADGRIDRYEEYLVRKVADLLYVPHAGYIQAKLAVLEDAAGE